MRRAVIASKSGADIDKMRRAGEVLQAPTGPLGQSGERPGGRRAVEELRPARTRLLEMLCPVRTLGGGQVSAVLGRQQ